MPSVGCWDKCENNTKEKKTLGKQTNNKVQQTKWFLESHLWNNNTLSLVGNEKKPTHTQCLMVSNFKGSYKDRMMFKMYLEQGAFWCLGFAI